MAISWDFTAGAKAAAASRAASAKEESNFLKAIDEGQREKAYENKQRELTKQKQDEAVKAQEDTFKLLEKQTENTFDTSKTNSFGEGVEASNYGSINDVFDYSSQQLINTYMKLYQDKDMDSDERALGLKKLTSQIPLLKTAKKSLDAKLEAWTAATLSGDGSGAMDPKFQRMYADLREGKFEGGIDYVDGETRLIGKTTDGQDINLMLKDFEQHLPSVLKSGGNITSKLSATKQAYKAQHDAYLKDPKNKPLPVYDVDSQASTIATEIGQMGDDGLKRFGVDVLNYSVEDIDNMIDAYQTGKKEVPLRRKMGDRTYNALTPAQQARFKPDGSTLNKSEAMLYVADDLAKEQANIELTYLQEGTNYLKPHTPQRRPDPLFIQQADVKYNSIMNGASIEQEDIDTTLFTNNGYPNVEKFEEKGDKLYITIGGGTQGNEKDNNFKEIPSKQVVVDLSDPRDLQKYMTNKGYDGLSQGEDIKGRDRSIMTSQKLADYYRKKELERRKEEASETRRRSLVPFGPENSFSFSLNEDGLPTE